MAADGGLPRGEAGVGIGYAAMPTLILDAVPTAEAASAVGVNALMRSVGTTLAAAVMATVLTSSTKAFGGVAFPSEGAFRWCFALGALAAFAGVAIAAFVPRRARRLRSRRLRSQPGVRPVQPVVELPQLGHQRRGA